MSAQSPLTYCSAPNPTQEIDQDPKYTARSMANKSIGVPKCAAIISRAFRLDAKAINPANKRHKISSSTTRSNFEDWAMSEEDVGDIQFLITDDEESNNKGKGKSS
jgi:ubiquitin-conjugating enzyme E2 Q